MLVTRKIIHRLYEESSYSSTDIKIHFCTLIQFPMYASSHKNYDIRTHCVTLQNGDLCFNTYYPLSDVSHGIYNIHSYSKLVRW